MGIQRGCFGWKGGGGKWQSRTEQEQQLKKGGEKQRQFWGGPFFSLPISHIPSSQLWLWRVPLMN